MQKIFLTVILIYVTGITSLMANPTDQRPVTDANIFGHVIDAKTGEHLPFVNLLIKGTRIGTFTDASGHYLLTNLPEGRHVLQVQSIGYAPAEVAIEAIAKTTREVDIKLSPTSINISEIVLTASPTASGFRYQPDAVFMGEQIQRRAEPSFGEMLNGQPGVAMRSFGSAPARPVIRGMDGDRILVLENGERMGDISETSADHSISLDPLVASRVEVIRGPASLLYGSSALGGVINLMTTDIPDQWDEGVSGVVSGQAATMNNMGAGFGRLTYGGDRNAFSARMAMRQSGDITTPEGRIPNTAMKNYDGALGWGMQRDRINGGLSFSLSDQAFGIPESIDIPEENVEIRAQRMALQGRLGGKLAGSWFDQAQLRFNATRFQQQEVQITRPEGGLSHETTGLEYNQNAFSSTLTLQHKPTGIFDRGALGFSFNGQKLNISGIEAYTPGEQRVTLATFTFQEIPLSYTTRMQFGVRLDFQNSTALKNEVFPNADLTRNAFNYSGSIGLNVRPFEGLEIGGQIARSHRNPMIEELFAEGVHLGAGVYEMGNPELKDEIGHGADMFINYRKGNFDIEVTGFVNEFSNYIILQPSGTVHEPTGYPIFTYAEGESVLFGSEISLGWQLAKRVRLQSGTDWVRGIRRIGEGPDENLPFIPPFRFNNEIEYDFTRGWLGAGYMAVSRQGKVAPGEAATDGYSLLNLQAGYRINQPGRHVFILKVQNALNTKYRDHLSRIEDRNFVMPGRNINLTYRWFF
ncbi:MAG: TonB-dependent receptor [Bacteroidota bacterium]